MGQRSAACAASRRILVPPSARAPCSSAKAAVSAGETASPSRFASTMESAVGPQPEVATVAAGCRREG